MKCKITECCYNNDCGILDITKKQPVDKKKCSYFETSHGQAKKHKRRANIDTEE